MQLDPQDTNPLSRRQFLSTSGAFVTGTMLAGQQSATAELTRMDSPEGSGMIDVHHHYNPPAIQKLGDTPPTASMNIWTPQISLEKMDRDGIDTAVLQVVRVGTERDARLPSVCRECNEYGARLAVDHPNRFGFFATTPLPDIDGSLKEIEYALDILHADGIGVLSHYGQSQYLGHPRYTPIWEELNRRKAIVFIHPRNGDYVPPVGTSEDHQDPFIQGSRESFPGLPAAPAGNVLSLELPFDTTRTLYSLQSARTNENYPNVKIIVAHAGGAALTFPARMAYEAVPAGDLGYKQQYANVLKFLSSLYYDFTIAFSPAMIRAVRETVPASHLLCGTDFPPVIKAHHEVAAEMIERLRSGLQANEFNGVRRKNAETLFPRFVKRPNNA